jgi:VIT1/CCC1 family predicted Fe2+/Mn2+ transporter
MAGLRDSFVKKYLDPASSLGELVFGLIMTLTFTLGAGIMLEEEGREGARQLLNSTIGCNIAWGIIDGALYLVGQLFERGRRRRVLQQVREAKGSGDAVALIATELDDIMAGVTTTDERQGLYRRIVDKVRSDVIPPNRITREDTFGAIASFWLVFFTSLPAAVPFLFIDEPRVALRVSNAILLALLFYVGYAWARYTTAKPLLTGCVFLLAGVALVALAIALGG